VIEHHLHTGLVGYRLKGTRLALDCEDGDRQRLFKCNSRSINVAIAGPPKFGWYHQISRHPFRPETSLVNKTPRARRIPKCNWVGYHSERAVVVVEGATPATAVTGAITMIVVGILFNVVGLGVICWALFALAIHALPFFVGLTAGSIHFGLGWVRSGPSSLVSSWPVAHSLSGGTPSPLRPVPLSASSLGSYSLFRLHVPDMMSPLPFRTSAFARNGGGSRSLCWAPSPSGVPPGRVSMRTDPTLRSGVALGPNRSPNGATTAGG
jgi:hypothetical protein